MSFILPYLDHRPVIAPDAYIAPNATVIGNVEIGAGSSLWFNVTLRGDVAAIRVGSLVNIQDGTVVHVSGERGGTTIGDRVSIGHMALIHACVLENDCFVGMNAVVMDEAVVETGAMVAAGALVTPRKRIPTGELWGGRPAKLLRKLTDEDRLTMSKTAMNYAKLAQQYRAETTRGVF